MATEVQLMEIEALQAIYADELILNSEDKLAFEIMISGDLEQINKPAQVNLKFKFKEGYPESEIPEILVIPIEGISSEKLEELTQSLINLAQSSIGMEMIFTLISHCKEWIETNCIFKEEKIEILDISQIVAESKPVTYTYSEHDKEEEENKQKMKDGTPVNLETFLAWRDKFDAEINKKVKKVEASKKVTGKQLFEQDSKWLLSDLTLEAATEAKNSITTSTSSLQSSTESKGDIEIDEIDASQFVDDCEFDE
eukprot:TRINITY_DN104_c7_g1_i1.p1 TRINITY_DN104_c7_g1~~TRINITY_DN104_c7_g1_i1.p1  ORF type:complete len:254 (-),score=92.62 TRINITY_DN104_c7_g1_i1:163-924(-)